ncbi:MAG: hypothetical protein KY476_26750, partial [Planctomycetes bacterium]|nr:hypothetical protein [Planctomycetota bacterium]
AELFPARREGRYALRLWAFPEAGTEPPTALARSPVIVTSPPLTVRAGQIVHISGWLHLATPITRTPDGVLVYDSLSGPAGAIRFSQATPWQRFELIREVHASGELTITCALSGLGEVRFDDLRVIAHEPRADSPPPPVAEQPPADGSRWSGPIDLLERFPYFRSRTQRQ